MQNIESASSEKKEQIIMDTVKNLVQKMGIDSSVEIDESAQEDKDAENMICNIKTEESNYLIGQYGVNLQALQHIARVMVRKKIDSKVNFILDVNSYRREKNESISSLAKNMAEQCLAEKRAVVMRPMSPYERRLVHIELAKNEKIKTESIGEGDNRRIVIRPSDLIS